MILDTDLLSEIQNDPIGIGYAGAGARPIYNIMTAPGSASVEAWVTASGPMPIPVVDFLQLLDVDEAAAFADTIAVPTTPLAKALKFKLDHTTSIDMTLASNRAMVVALQSVGDIPIANAPLKAATVQAMLRKGEVLQSRAQELWGENPALEQIQGVLNG